MTGRFWRYAMAGVLAATSLFAARSEAGVVMGGTRVVYPSQDREVTIKLSNEGKIPSLVQVWMDNGDEQSTPDATKVPFTILPPISRIEPGKSQAVRVLYTKEPLPTDKESLFWFNLLDVPPKANNPDGKNLMQFAVRTRIKFFFRPSGLAGDAITAPDKLTWKLVNGEDGKGVALQATNPTPYYVNFASVSIVAGKHVHTNKHGGMVAPGASSIFPIPDLASRPEGDVKAAFEAISDYGGIGAHESPLSQ
jgi:chaperone protein EcpD